MSCMRHKLGRPPPSSPKSRPLLSRLSGLKFFEEFDCHTRHLKRLIGLMNRLVTKTGLVGLLVIASMDEHFAAQRRGPAANGGSLAPDRIGVPTTAKPPSSEDYREAARYLGLNYENVMLPCAVVSEPGRSYIRETILVHLIARDLSLPNPHAVGCTAFSSIRSEGGFERALQKTLNISVKETQERTRTAEKQISGALERVSRDRGAKR